MTKKDHLTPISTFTFPFYLRGRWGFRRLYPLPPKALNQRFTTSKSKETVKFQPEKRTARLSGLVYCTGIQGM